MSKLKTASQSQKTQTQATQTQATPTQTKTTQTDTKTLVETFKEKLSTEDVQVHFMGVWCDASLRFHR